MSNSQIIDPMPRCRNTLDYHYVYQYIHYLYLYLQIKIQFHTLYNSILIVYNIMFICIHKSILFLTFLIILFIFYYCYCLFVCFVIFCSLAAMANEFPHLWDNKGILIVILIPSLLHQFH